MVNELFNEIREALKVGSGTEKKVEVATRVLTEFANRASLETEKEKVMYYAGFNAIGLLIAAVDIEEANQEELCEYINIIVGITTGVLSGKEEEE